MMPKLEKIERAVSQKRINITNDDVDLITELCAATDGDLVMLATGSNSLAEKPGKNNWIERTSDIGLPTYIAEIAKALIRSGKTKSQAISIAISRCKAWMAGGDNVNADTRAKAAKAIAEWNALRAKAAAKKASKTKK